MFTQEIHNTPFTISAAENYFTGKISANNRCLDETFISTLRALLMDRINKDDPCFSLTYYSSVGTERYFNNHDADDVAYFFKSNCTYENNMSVISLGCYADGLATKIYDNLESNFVTAGGGSDWVRITAVTEFFKKNFPVLCFVNEKYRGTVFVIKKDNIRIIHQLQVAAISAVPWFFNPVNGDKLSPIERELLESLMGNDPNKYIQCLEKIAESRNFREEFIRSKVSNFETKYEQVRIRRISAEIEELNDRIRKLRNTINDTLVAINDKNTEYEGLRYKIENNQSNSLLENYLINNENIIIDNISDSRIEYHVLGNLIYFDEKEAREMINNRDSDMYAAALNAGFTRKQAAALIRALFIDETIRIRVCAGYAVDTRGRMEPCSCYNFHGDDVDRMPNPHIQVFACIGQYEGAMVECLLKRNFVGAIELSVASAQSLKLTDGYVMNRFFGDLFLNTTTQWFELPDGKKVALGNALEYLIEEWEDNTDE